MIIRSFIPTAASSALLLLALLTFAVTGSHAAGDVLPPPTGRIVDYSEIQEIFNKRCLECHEGDNAPNELTLVDLRSYNLLIDEPAHEFPSLKRVKPGSATKSYLFLKINTPVPPFGSRMPIGFVLPVEEQVAIRDWINQGAQAINRNPVLSAAPTLNPAAPRAGEGIRFSAAATDPNNDPITFNWDFGDGTTGVGADVVHTYAAAGLFTTVLTVKDDRTGLVSASLDVTVVPDSDTDGDGIPNLADADDDGDGFTDGIELALQTDPLDPASTPLGGSIATPQALTVKQFKAKFDFKKTSNDSLSAQLLFTLPDGFSAANQQAVFDLGGIVRVEMLDAKGAFKSDTDSAKLQVKKLKTGGSGGTLSVKLKASLLADTFLGLQKASEPDADDAALPRTFSIFVGGTVFTATHTVTYKRKKSGPGSTALTK